MAGKNGKEDKPTGAVIQSADQSSTDRSTEAPASEKGRTGANTGANTGAEKEKLSGLAILTDPKDVDVPAPAEPKKAKRKRSKPVKNDTVFNTEQIKSILMTASGVLSQSETGKIFALTEGEAEQIAKPLSNIIAKNDAFSGMGEHADSIALATACAMIFLPRLFLLIELKKQKKALKDKNIKIVKGVDSNEQKGATGSHSGKVNGAVTPGNTYGSTGIMSGLPSLA